MEERLTTEAGSRREARIPKEPGAPAAVYLSVVIPAYNEAERIPSSLSQVLAYLESSGKSYEVVVVDDGSTDETARIVESICSQNRGVRLLRNHGNCGKGAAVRNGVLNARGEYILFSDADLSAPIADAPRLLEALENAWDVAIGSRALRRDWIGVRQPRFRELAGKLFNLFMRILTGLNFHDTQCGFKAFRRQAAEAIFALQRIQGFGFDVEILYLARKLGYKILEVPVHWDHSAATKVHPLRDGMRMALDVLKIRWKGTANREQVAGEKL